MTAAPVLPAVPDQASVVEVYGSKFLLEWLDREVLASVAALHLRAQRPVDGPPGRTSAG
jgi:hypothetical protein